ncbi:hypothetical protein [Desulfonauticus submarinus]
MKAKTEFFRDDFVNLAYEIEIEVNELPKEQYNEYKWFSVEEIMTNDEIHK